MHINIDSKQFCFLSCFCEVYSGICWEDLSSCSSSAIYQIGYIGQSPNFPRPHLKWYLTSLSCKDLPCIHQGFLEDKMIKYMWKSFLRNSWVFQNRIYFKYSKLEGVIDIIRSNWVILQMRELKTRKIKTLVHSQWAVWQNQVSWFLNQCFSSLSKLSS